MKQINDETQAHSLARKLPLANHIYKFVMNIIIFLIFRLKLWFHYGFSDAVVFLFKNLIVTCKLLLKFFQKSDVIQPLLQTTKMRIIATKEMMALEMMHKE